MLVQRSPDKSIVVSSLCDGKSTGVKNVVTGGKLDKMMRRVQRSAHLHGLLSQLPPTCVW